MAEINLPKGLGALRSYTQNAGTRRSWIVTLPAAGTATPIPLGNHSHLMVENIGANTLQLCQSVSSDTANPTDWIEAAANKVLDGDTDEMIVLASVGGTDVRLTVWGNPREEGLKVS